MAAKKKSPAKKKSTNIAKPIMVRAKDFIHPKLPLEKIMVGRGAKKDFYHVAINPHNKKEVIAPGTNIVMDYRTYKRAALRTQRVLNEAAINS